MKSNVYGKTAIRSLLRMSSGVRFTEDYSGNDDLSKFAWLQGTKGSIAGLQAFDNREAPPGERFHYALIETSALAATLRAATGKTLAEYVTERLWQPLGAEADATWITAPDGLERAAGNFNATLRNWAPSGVGW